MHIWDQDLYNLVVQVSKRDDEYKPDITQIKALDLSKKYITYLKRN